MWVQASAGIGTEIVPASSFKHRTATVDMHCLVTELGVHAAKG